MKIISHFLVIPITCFLIVLPNSYVHAENMVTKQVCLSSFGMNWKTSEEAQRHLLMSAKREAVGELFGEMIRSISEVRDFTLTRDEIKSLSAGFVRINGSPEYFNGPSPGEYCVKIQAYITNEDRIRFEPRPVKRKVCIADPRLSLGEIRKTAEQQARIQAVRDFEPNLSALRDDVVLNLIHESKTESGGFIPETETYCVNIVGKVYPIELMSVTEKTGLKSELEKKGIGSETLLMIRTSPEPTDWMAVKVIQSKQKLIRVFNDDKFTYKSPQGYWIIETNGAKHYHNPSVNPKEVSIVQKVGQKLFEA